MENNTAILDMDGHVLKAVFYERKHDCIRDFYLYELRDEFGSIIFNGNDFGIPAGSDINERMVDLVGFLTCRYGDTDDDYFDDYNMCQMLWVDTYAEQLSYFGMEDE